MKEQLSDLCDWLKNHINYANQNIEAYKDYKTLPEAGWREYYSGCSHTAKLCLESLEKILTPHDERKD